MSKQDSEIVVRTLLKSGLILLTIGLSTFAIMFYLVGNKFDQVHNEEISSITSIITSSIEAADKAADTYERLIDMRLLSVSKAIAKQLQGKSVSMITEADLVKLKQEWGLSDISLFVPREGDIVVAKSSDPKEVGLSSKSWGYWFTAFNQLLELTPVQVKEGFSHSYFWAGPLTKSVLYSEQFLYAYYYDGTTDYIINPYISAAEVQIYIDSYGPDQFIHNLIKGSADIAEIAVLNIEPYLKEERTEVVEPKKDLPVLYGIHHSRLKEDRAVLSNKSFMKAGGSETVSFQKDGLNFKKIYVPLSDNRVLTIVIDMSKRNTILYQLLGIMAVVYLAAFLIIYAVAKKLSSRSLLLLDKINRLAYFDTLTGLPNRNHFQDYLKTALEDAKINRFALFMIDLDNFKTINDTFGHAAGDRFLVDASARLHKQLNGSGFLARIGGDEFTLILPIQTPSHAEEVANRLLLSFQEPFLLEGTSLTVSMSIGISLYPNDGVELKSLMKCADTALYYEKYKEKNNFSFFNKEFK